MNFLEQSGLDFDDSAFLVNYGRRVFCEDQTSGIKSHVAAFKRDKSKGGRAAAAAGIKSAAGRRKKYRARAGAAGKFTTKAGRTYATLGGRNVGRIAGKHKEAATSTRAAGKGAKGRFATIRKAERAAARGRVKAKVGRGKVGRRKK